MSLMDTIDQLDLELMTQARTDFETHSLLAASEKASGEHVVLEINLFDCTATCKCGRTFHRPTPDALQQAFTAHAHGRIAKVTMRGKL